MIGYILAILSPISFSLNNIFYKKLLKKLDVWSSLVITFSSVSFTMGLGALIFGDFNHNIDLSFLIKLLIGGLFGIIGIWGLLKSFENLKVSESLAIANIYPFIVLGLNALILKKVIHLEKIYFMLLVFLGIFFTLKNNERFVFNSKLIYPLVTAFSWGIYSFLLGSFAGSEISLYNVTFYFETTIFLFLLLFILIKRIKVKTNHNREILKNGILAGIFSGLGSLFFVLSTEYINSAIASSINSTQIIFSTIFAFLIFNEKLNKFQIVGIFLVFLSLVFFKIKGV